MLEPAGDQSTPYDDVVAAVSDDIRHELAPATHGEPTTDGERGPDGEPLQLTGLEGAILTWALKTVVGAVANFVGKVAYDRWKESRTRKQLTALLADLDVDAAGAGDPAVDEATLRHELVTELADQGLTVRQAEAVIDRALVRVHERLASRPGA